MQNIQIGSNGKIHFNVFKDGVLSQADNPPTISIYDADLGGDPIIGFFNLPVINEPEDGVYSFMLTSAITQINRTLEVKWSYRLNDLPYLESSFYGVETVYSSTPEIQDFLQFGARPSDLNYHSTEEIQSAEKIARTIINGYTGQKFDRRYGTQEMFGKGSDGIEVIEKMLTIDRMWENDTVVIDNTVDPVYNTFGFPLEITQTGFAIRIKNADWDVRYDNQVDPTILYYGRFRDNSRYKFQGEIGYKYVPNDIKIASMLLVSDILANDFNWRNKYLQKVDLSEISFEMAGGAFNGTGNITVDNILDQYRNTNIVII